MRKRVSEEGRGGKRREGEWRREEEGRGWGRERVGRKRLSEGLEVGK